MIIVVNLCLYLNQLLSDIAKGLLYKQFAQNDITPSVYQRSFCDVSWFLFKTFDGLQTDRPTHQIIQTVLLEQQTMKLFKQFPLRINFVDEQKYTLKVPEDISGTVYLYKPYP